MSRAPCWLFTVVEKVPGAAAGLSPSGVASASSAFPGAFDFESDARQWPSRYWGAVVEVTVTDAHAAANIQAEIDERIAANASMIERIKAAHGITP